MARVAKSQVEDAAQAEAPNALTISQAIAAALADDPSNGALHALATSLADFKSRAASVALSLGADLEPLLEQIRAL